MSGMVERSLTDLLAQIVDNRGRSCPVAEGGFPLIATNCIKDDHKYPMFENVRYVDQRTYDSWFRGHPQPNDILFVCKGSPGRVAMVPDPVPFCIAQDMVALRVDPQRVDHQYLFYRLKTPEVRAKIGNLHVGTMIPHFKKGDFGKLKFEIHHDLGRQRAIAEVLGALDEKIGANARLTVLLSDHIDASFGSIVGPWLKHVRFGDLVTVTKGVSYRSADLVPSATALVTLKSIQRDGTYSARGLKSFAGAFKETQRVLPGEVVVAQTDLTQAADVIGHAVRVTDASEYGQLVASLDLAIVRPIPDVPMEFVLGVMRDPRFREHCKSRTTGTTVLHLAGDAIRTFLAPDVTSELQERYAAVAAPMYCLRDGVTSESVSIVAMRDALLPQLMSGRIRVKDAEQMVGDVV